MMFDALFGKKKKATLTPSQLTVDIHSHLIPGIDDGAQSMEESIALLQAFEELGYEKIITTPHIMSDSYPNSMETILSGLEALRMRAELEGISLQIEAAAEYYLDEYFFDEMQKTEVLTIDDTYVLFESSYFARPLQMEEMIFAIGEAGYKAMMAHPERCRYIKNPRKEFGRLKELGVFFQVNINSFGGHYGVQARKFAEFLSEAGMIDFLGSDVHHMRQVESLKNVLHSDRYREIFKYNTILNGKLYQA
jgi:tyrosine-protein phosphatase YwqE